MNELDLFEAAIATADPVQRAALLDRACAGKPELRARLVELLAAHCRSNPLLDQPLAVNTIDIPGDAGKANAAARVETAGTIIAGRYKLLQQIGEGGMGSVWMADQTEPVKRRVAVKLIRVERGQSKRILSRFEAERQAIALMDHPHIARLLDAGTANSGAPFFVMELVKGVPLTDFCDTHKLGIPERLNLFMQICAAVQHAHQKGVIHRDLKPSNILVESHDGKPMPKIIDFGLAKATTGLQLTENTLFTAFGSVMGTPLYMAPEQASFNALDVDTRADIYALGIILYELLTGTTPITRDTLKKAALDEILKVIREQEVPTPSSRLSSAGSAPSVAANRQTEPAKLGRFVKGELDWIVLKALAKERDRRYETANGLAKDIERFLNHEPVTAGPPTVAYRVRKFARRNRGPVIAASLVLLALVAGVIGTTVGMLEAKRAAEAERKATNDALEQKRLAEQAAANERQAKLQEAERADGERKAKFEAERNLAFAKNGNEILGSVFAGLNPNAIAESGRPLQDVLRENLGKAVKELDGSGIGDPLEVAAMQEALGRSLLGLGEYALAVEVFGKALKTRQAKLGPDHADTLAAMNNLAAGYRANGQLELAVALYEQTLKLLTAKLGPDHHLTLTTMGNLAVAYNVARQPDKSVPLHEQTLELRKAKFGPDHPATLHAMNNLASAYQDAGQLNKALALYEETLKLRKVKLGPDHPHTLSTMRYVAGGYKDAGQFEKAVALYQQALKFHNAKLGPDHPETLDTMSNLALAYEAGGKLDLALPLWEETLKLRKAKQGPDHASTLTTMNNLAALFWRLNRLDQSIPLFEMTLTIREKILGRQHPDTLMTMANLGVNYMGAGRLKEAIPHLEEAYRAFGKHPRLTFVCDPLAVAYTKAGETAKLADLLGEMLAEARKPLTKDSPQLAGQLAQIGAVLLRQKKWSEAEPLLRECLTIRVKTQPDAWSTFNCQSLLGGALLGQKKYAEAEPLLLQGYEGLKAREEKIPPQSKTGLSKAFDRLIELYTVTNRPDEAKKWQAQRAKNPEGKVKAPEKK